LRRILKTSPLLLPLALLFWPLTALVLYCDSSAVISAIGYGQWPSTLLALAYLAALLSQMNPQHRLLTIVFVPLSAIGETIFSLGLDLYRYQLEAIPLYVPLGHSILLAVGLAYSDTSWVERHRRLLDWGLTLFHVLLVGGALLLFNDTLSAIFMAMFLLLLRRRIKNRTAYLLIGVLVLYVELLGTYWGCWVWELSPLGWLHTTNPPTGAFACYVVGELAAVRYAIMFGSWWARYRTPHLATRGA
jgi:hypothetical protein